MTLRTSRAGKVIANGLGGLDLASMPGPNGVVTVLTIHNAADGQRHRMCTLFSLPAGSLLNYKIQKTGFSLSMKNGVPTACPSCTDGRRNGDETDVDCGGPECGDCAVGKGCTTGSDCVTGVCSQGVCLAASCADGVRNGNETDTDCGGSCQDCADGQACAVDGDCTSGVCDGGTCAAPACDDDVRNGGETDLDCGGPCPGCPVGGRCNGGADCASGVCVPGFCAPPPPTCTDGIRNGVETDVDCGGAVCQPCGPGDSCFLPTDCTSLVCNGLVCQPPTCTDGVRNGAEEDIDCGGPACPACPTPVVTIDAPTHGIFSLAASTNVTGHVEGIRLDDATLTVNGTVIPIQPNGTFSTSVPLSTASIFNPIHAILTAGGTATGPSTGSSSSPASRSRPARTPRTASGCGSAIRGSTRWRRW